VAKTKEKELSRRRDKKAKEKFEKKVLRSRGRPRTRTKESSLAQGESDSSSEGRDTKRDSAYEERVRQQFESELAAGELLDSDGEKRRPDRNKKREAHADVFFDWNDITPYFRRMRPQELDMLRLQCDYGVGAIKKVAKGEKPKTLVDEILTQLREVRSRKKGSSDLTVEVQQMAHKDNVTINSVLFKTGGPFSRILKFGEKESQTDAPKTLPEDSTKGSPTDRTQERTSAEQNKPVKKASTEK